MTKKLLHKTLRVYLIFSVILLVVSAPLFYYITKGLYIEEIDETLDLHKNEFLEYSLSILTIQEIPNWNKYNRNVKIEPFENLLRDTLFYNSYYDSLEAETEPYRELNAPVVVDGYPYTYKARINLVETEDLMESIAFLFFVVISLLLIGLFIITKRLSIKLWRPFNETLNQIQKFEIDKATKPFFLETDIEEFKRLNECVGKLIDKNTSIYMSQKEFVENAAHELQTPLAVFQVKIDTLFQGADFTQEQYAILSSLNESVSRLNRLNKNLLLLSKLDNDSYSGKESICLNEVIEKNFSFFTEQAVAKTLNLQFELTENLFVESNPILAEVFVSNLLLNAIRHNKQGGQIVVKLYHRSLVITNSGQLKPLIAHTLFTRFSKSNPSEHGNGLGLAIVKKIANLNNWNISYSFADNLHSFSVTF